jgi:hypothetical protein
MAAAKCSKAQSVLKKGLSPVFVFLKRFRPFAKSKTYMPAALLIGFTWVDRVSIGINSRWGRILLLQSLTTLNNIPS